MEKNLIKKKPIYGRRNIEEFLSKPSKHRIVEVWVKESFYGEALSTVLKSLPNKSRIQRKSAREMDSSLPGANHQGIVLWIQESEDTPRTRNYKEWKENLKSHSGPILLLDRIQDPGNLGSILRTAECFGVKTVIYPEKGSCGITDVVSKISSGAVHYLDIFQVPSLSRTIEELKKKEYWIVATSEEGSEDWEILPSFQDLAVLMGNEGEGIRPILLQESDFLVRIPLHGNLSSLNVGVACGITLDRIVNRDR